MKPDQVLRNEIATAISDPYQSVFDGLLRPNDDTLASRGGSKGLKIYDEIERDCHAFSVLQKRRLALVSRPVVIEAASDSPLDKKARDLVERQLKGFGFDRLCMHLMDAILKGYAVGEIIWEQRGNEVWVARTKERDARRFLFDVDDRVKLRTRNNPWPGEPMPERKFIVHRYGAKDGNPYGLGLGTRLFWPVWFKRQGIQFWLTFADKFGSPTAVGTYQPGTTLEDQQALLDALGRISQDAGVVVPEGTAISLLEAARSGTVNTYEALCRYMDEEISKAVLGETLSTSLGGGGGSLAAARAHNEVRLELVEADADLLTDTLAEQLIRWMVEFNLPGATPPRVYRDCRPPEDQNSRAERDERLVRVGYRPTQEAINQAYGEGYEAISPLAPSSALPTSAIGDYAEADPAGFPGQVALDAALAKLDPGAMAAQMGALLAPAIKAVSEGRDDAELIGLLAEAFPQMDATALTQELSRLLFLADLVGRITAQSEQAGQT